MFKSKGAERKHKTDRDRMAKVPDAELHYQPSYDCTLLTTYKEEPLVPPSTSSTSLALTIDGGIDVIGRNSNHLDTIVASPSAGDATMSCSKSSLNGSPTPGDSSSQREESAGVNNTTMMIHQHRQPQTHLQQLQKHQQLDYNIKLASSTTTSSSLQQLPPQQHSTESSSSSSLPGQIPSPIQPADTSLSSSSITTQSITNHSQIAQLPQSTSGVSV